MKLFTLTAAAVIAGSSLFGLLPPECQRAKEISEIKQSEDFNKLKAFDPGNINVESTKDGYIVESENFTMHVKVTYLHDGTIGPAKYKLEYDLPTVKSEPSEPASSLENHESNN